MLSLHVSLILALHLVRLTGLDNQPIDVNPEEVTNVRPPRGTDIGHFGPGVKCLVFMADGKPLTVIETFEDVHRILLEATGK